MKTDLVSYFHDFCTHANIYKPSKLSDKLGQNGNCIIGIGEGELYSLPTLNYRSVII